MAERALWAGPGVRLPDGAAGVVEFALHPGGYVRFGEDEYVLVAHPRAPRGPLSLLVTGLHRTPLQHGDRADRVGGVEEIEAKPSLAIDQEDDRNGAIEQMQRRFGHRPRVRGGQHEVNPAGPAGAVYAFGQDIARIGQQAAEVVAQPVIRRQHQDVGLGHV
jgi:hypothetical protein